MKEISKKQVSKKTEDRETMGEPYKLPELRAALREYMFRVYVTRDKGRDVAYLEDPLGNLLTKVYKTSFQFYAYEKVLKIWTRAKTCTSSGLDIELVPVQVIDLDAGVKSNE